MLPQLRDQFLAPKGLETFCLSESPDKQKNLSLRTLRLSGEKLPFPHTGNLLKKLSASVGSVRDKRKS